MQRGMRTLRCMFGACLVRFCLGGYMVACVYTNEYDYYLWLLPYSLHPSKQYSDQQPPHLPAVLNYLLKSLISEQSGKVP